jgi:hypothetical protein
MRGSASHSRHRSRLLVLQAPRPIATIVQVGEHVRVIDSSPVYKVRGLYAGLENFGLELSGGRAGATKVSRQQTMLEGIVIFKV